MAASITTAAPRSFDHREPRLSGLGRLATPWRLVLLVGLPVWLAAGAFRILGMYLVAHDVPGVYFMLPTPPRVAQHLAMVPFVLVAYRLAIAVGWPDTRRASAVIGHGALAIAVSALGRPALLIAGNAFRPEDPMPVLEGLQGIGFSLWVSTSLDFMLAYLFGLAAMAFLHTAGTLQRSELERSRLAGAWTEARLQALRMQLNPHFLFNAFNLVATLLERDPPQARSVLLSLSSLFRRTLATMDEAWATVSDEFEYAREYLSIQAARFGSRLSYEVQSETDLGTVKVPSMLLQPLVENAMVHGADDDAATLHVRVRAERLAGPGVPECLSIEVTNRTSGRLDAGHHGPGVGLATTRDRLQACYGGRATMEFGPDGEDTYRVRLTLPVGGAVPGRDSGVLDGTP